MRSVVDGTLRFVLRLSAEFLFDLMLSEKAIIEYMEIYKKEFGKDISYEQALEGGTKLLCLFKLIYKPIPKDWVKKLKHQGKKNEK